ncbi:HD-GYP domain-containing protein [Clostridium cochlearium]|uniref:HD domain-containing protein n=1 Tax=Clostridium cochlearium TaxID=1494 RepID=A0A7Y3V6Q0_CLOCO|nr:HD domain-containing phosphohydrolase [Clostridium cochlearium]NOH15481.1 HD domain-containing protein [Clostridium cochlearium]
MNDIILEHDIYNDEGVLILSKGSQVELTQEMRLKLSRIGVLEELLQPKETKEISDKEKLCLSKIPTSDTSCNMTVYEKAKNYIVDFSKKYHKVDTYVFQQAHTVLDNLIYNSQDMQWHRHLLIIMNYVDWLYAHSINTALISCIIGTKLNYTGDKLKDLALGAILHDIGLVLLPTEILNKTIELTDVEMTIMKNHCELGYKMMQNIELSEKSKNIILQHHEKNDGSGYPKGLCLNDICEESRIVIIAEYFDTATTQRPYKHARCVNSVLNEMKLRPDLYDASIVDILCENIGE